MSRYEDISALLDSLGESATVEEVEYALRDHIAREVIAVLADRAAAGGAFDGGTIADPLAIGPITDFSDPLTIDSDDAGFGAHTILDASGTFQITGTGGSTSRIEAKDDQSSEYARLDSEKGVDVKNSRSGGGLTVRASDSSVKFSVTPGSNAISVAMPLKATERITTQLHAAPADGDLAAGECALWFDQTNGAAKLKIKAKSANGTVVSGEVALT